MKNSEAGFTLIEMLCVLVLISLLSGVVIMNIPNPKSPAQIQAEGLTRDLNAMAQEGLISGEVRAFGLTEKQFSFFAYDGEEFIPAGGNIWSDEIRTEFTRNGEKLKLPETLTPQILFEPTSINTPFVLDLSGRKGRYEIRSEGDGRVVLVKTE